MSRKKINKIEAENGEVVQSNIPFIIRNGGIAKPLGQGLYLLRGKTHEQGGIDIDFTGDARIFSAQPILNGNSPAELVARGANPNITFNRQERFKDVNRINDDGSRKAKYGKLQKKFVKSTEENPITLNDFNKGLFKHSEGSVRDINFDNLTRSDIATDIDVIDKDNYFYTIASDSNGRPVHIYDLKDSNDLPAGYTKNNNNEIKQSYINARKKLDYIGGGNEEKSRFFGKTRSIVNAVDSLSNVYGINKDIMLHRLSKEGLITDLTNVYNYSSNKEQQKNIGNYSLNNGVLAFDQLGLDRAGEHLSKGHYNMRWKDKNLGYWDEYHTNEDGVVVHSVGVPNLASGLEIMAAHIEYLTNFMKKKYPEASKKEIDTFVNAAYNLGEYHKDLNEREWINKNYEVLPWSEMINKSMNNSNKKRLGGSTGLIRVQANGKDRLMYVPFTGEETKASRKKADLGTELSNDERNKLNLWYDKQGVPNYDRVFDKDRYTIAFGESKSTSTTPVTPTTKDKIAASWDVNGKTLISTLAEPQTNDSKLPDKITLSPGVKSQINKSVEDTYNKNNKPSWWKNDWAAPTISALGNIGAGLTSYLINRNMLKDLDYAPTPVAKRAAKLKTNININPELTALSENLSKTIDATNANTASSRVANARNQASMLNTTLTANKLYTDKENRETALINQDRLNQQEVANANIDAYNTWRTGKTNFENTVREQLSENAVSLVDNINKGIQTGITDVERRRQFRNNLAIMAAAYPNVTPALLRSYGADFLRMGGKVKLNKKK